MNVQTIDVSLIDPPLFNSRLDENKGTPAELKDLGESLKTKQLQPIGVVVHSDGKRYRLIWGSRRVAAAKLVNLTTLDAEVQEGISEGDEVLQNAIENLRRKDLSTFETARVCAELRNKGLKLDRVGSEVGLSKQHVSNLALCYDKLPPEVKKAWKEGEPGTDVSFLRSIITKEDHGKVVSTTPEEMIAAWTERKESLAAVDGEEEDDPEDEDEDGESEGPQAETGGAPIPPYRVQPKRYRDLLRALRKIKAAQVTIDVCRYLVGDIEKVRGVPIGDPKAPTKKTNHEKKGD